MLPSRDSLPARDSVFASLGASVGNQPTVYYGQKNELSPKHRERFREYAEQKLGRRARTIEVRWSVQMKIGGFVGFVFRAGTNPSEARRVAEGVWLEFVDLLIKQMGGKGNRLEANQRQQRRTAKIWTNRRRRREGRLMIHGGSFAH